MANVLEFDFMALPHRVRRATPQPTGGPRHLQVVSEEPAKNSVSGVRCLPTALPCSPLASNGNFGTSPYARGASRQNIANSCQCLKWVTGCRDDASRATDGLPSAADAPLQVSELAKSATANSCTAAKKLRKPNGSIVVAANFRHRPSTMTILAPDARRKPHDAARPDPAPATSLLRGSASGESIASAPRLA